MLKFKSCYNAVLRVWSGLGTEITRLGLVKDCCTCFGGKKDGWRRPKGFRSAHLPFIPQMQLEMSLSMPVLESGNCPKVSL